MHACFCIRSIEGQTKVNDSTGNLIAPYWGIWRSVCRPLWSFSICSALEYVASRLNVWKPRLLPFNYHLRRVIEQGLTQPQAPSSALQLVLVNKLRAVTRRSISHRLKRFISRIDVKMNRKVRITTLVQNYSVRSLYNFHGFKTCKASKYFQF